MFRSRLFYLRITLQPRSGSEYNNYYNGTRIILNYYRRAAKTAGNNHTASHIGRPSPPVRLHCTAAEHTSSRNAPLRQGPPVKNKVYIIFIIILLSLYCGEQRL